VVLISQIVCPVDFSAFSRRALEHAAAIARPFRSHLTVLHACSAPTGIAADPHLDDSAVRDPEADALYAALKEFAEPVTGGLAVRLNLMRADDVRRAIVTEAQAVGADLLVMGSHGRGGFERLFLGSITEKIVRHSPCPVLVVPHRADAPHGGRFHRIVCGIDFSPASLQAFRYAVHLAATEGAEVTLIHAIEVPPELREMQIAAAYDVDAIRDAAEAASLNRLRALAPGPPETTCRIHALVAEGRAHRQIVRIAEEKQADLIVVGTHGRSALDRWLFGSNTHAVLRDAPCPVLTVRA